MQKNLKILLKSQIAQFILAVILITVLIVSYVRIDDVIKFIGLPFKILPDVLGITESVSKIHRSYMIGPWAPKLKSRRRKGWKLK
jgi:hypothetical protein